MCTIVLRTVRISRCSNGAYGITYRVGSRDTRRQCKNTRVLSTACIALRRKGRVSEWVGVCVCTVTVATKMEGDDGQCDWACEWQRGSEWVSNWGWAGGVERQGRNVPYTKSEDSTWTLTFSSSVLCVQRNPSKLSVAYNITWWWVELHTAYT